MGVNLYILHANWKIPRVPVHAWLHGFNPSTQIRVREEPRATFLLEHTITVHITIPLQLPGDDGDNFAQESTYSTVGILLQPKLIFCFLLAEPGVGNTVQKKVVTLLKKKEKEQDLG